MPRKKRKGTKKPKWVNKSLVVKSREELWFSYWLDDCKSAGIILDWKYEDPTFKLSDNITYMSKNLDQSKSITCDFSITWNKSYKNKIYYNCSDTEGKGLFIVYDTNCKDNSTISYVDVKPVNEARNSSSISFPYKRSWLLQTQGIWVQKVKPFGNTNKLRKGDIGALFNETFTPTKLLRNKKELLMSKYNKLYAFVKWKVTTFNQYKKKLNEM